MRSPRTAPPENGLVGSTAITATLLPFPRYTDMRLFVSELFPAPGGPVIPILIDFFFCLRSHNLKVYHIFLSLLETEGNENFEKVERYWS